MARRRMKIVPCSEVSGHAENEDAFLAEDQGDETRRCSR